MLINHFRYKPALGVGVVRPARAPERNLLTAYDGRCKNVPSTILIVDDERPLADTLCEILRAAGYRCSVAYSGMEGLERVNKLNPALVITDVIMPGLNGIDLAKKIRAHHATCAVLLFSGNAATLDLLETARGEGHAFQVLAKPVPPPELLTAVAKMIARA